MSGSKLYTFKVRTLNGNDYDFNQLRDKVVVITNVASEIDYIPQYKALESLYQKYRGQGLEIIGFPCNQFGENEPGNADDIQRHLTKNQITFPIMEKIDVNGNGNVHPVYQWLKEQKSSFLMERIKWNFEKFLINRHGEVVDRYLASTHPESMEDKIKELLKEKPLMMKQ